MIDVRPTYAGIGSRETPREIMSVMWRIARRLEARGWVLHSGGAVGADTAFELGVRERVAGYDAEHPANAHVFLPWRGFNDANRQRFGLLGGEVIEPTKQATELAQRFHPAWHRLSEGVRKFMVRNCYQVLGPDLRSPVRCVVCWTKDGKASGGTGQALRIAAAYGVPIFNLHDPGSIARLKDFVLSAG